MILIQIILICSFSLYSSLDLKSVNTRISKTWSNREGLTLTPITTGIWAAERPFVWNKIDVGGRSVIARTSDGNLFVHSPVEWTEDLGTCLKSLGGEVKYIVSPNYEHLKFAKQWSEVYPNAVMYGCPGLIERVPEINWEQEIFNDVPKNIRNSFEVIHFDCEINPFTNKPFFNEIIFYHKKSKSLLVTDTFWNYPETEKPNYSNDLLNKDTGKQHKCSKIPTPDLKDELLPTINVPFGTKLWKFGMDKIYHPFYVNFMVGKGERKEKYDKIMSKLFSWDIENIVPCHGDVIRGKELCRKILSNHFLNV